jgi:hypothetical protein
MGGSYAVTQQLVVCASEWLEAQNAELTDA